MELISFETIKKSIPIISMNKNITIENTDREYACAYNNTILYNYNSIVKNLDSVFNGNINLINYNLIQALAHEIVHIENFLNNPTLDKDDAYKVYEYNSYKSAEYSFVNNSSYNKNHDSFIDEYYADIVGNLYALEYMINFKIKKEELYEINKDIAYQIYYYYQNGTYPLKKYNELIKKENFIEMLINKYIYGVPILTSLNKKKYMAVKPNENAINNTDFDKLMYGDNNNLTECIKLICLGKIRTVNIFFYLYQQSEKIYQKRLTNRK